MKTSSHGQQLAPIDFDTGVEVLERHGLRGELHFAAAQDDLEPHVLIAWADTVKDELHG